MPRRASYSSADTQRTCPLCSGSGTVANPRQPGTLMTCPMCGGTGRIARGQSGAMAARAYRRMVSRAVQAQVRSRVQEEMRNRQGFKRSGYAASVSRRAKRRRLR